MNSRDPSSDEQSERKRVARLLDTSSHVRSRHRDTPEISVGKETL